MWLSQCGASFKTKQYSVIKNLRLVLLIGRRLDSGQSWTSSLTRVYPKRSVHVGCPQKAFAFESLRVCTVANYFGNRLYRVRKICSTFWLCCKFAVRLLDLAIFWIFMFLTNNPWALNHHNDSHAVSPMLYFIRPGAMRALGIILARQNNGSPGN